MKAAEQHGVAENVTVENLVFGQALGARRDDVLLSDFVQERVLCQERHCRERADGHRYDRQHQMPEIVADFSEQRELVPIVRKEPARGEPLNERGSREEHQQ